jgi:hypothetical protein
MVLAGTLRPPKLGQSKRAGRRHRAYGYGGEEG